MTIPPYILELGPETLGYSRMGEEISDYFEKQGINDWELGSIASRKLVWKLQAELETLRGNFSMVQGSCQALVDLCESLTHPTP